MCSQQKLQRGVHASNSMVVIGAREPVSNPVSGGYSIYGKRSARETSVYAYVVYLWYGKMNSESATRLTDLNGVDLVKKDTQEEVEKEYFCGIGRFRPKCLQIFRDAKFFTFILCSFCFIEGAAASGS